MPRACDYRAAAGVRIAMIVHRNLAVSAILGLILVNASAARADASGCNPGDETWSKYGKTTSEADKVFFRKACKKSAEIAAKVDEHLHVAIIMQNKHGVHRLVLAFTHATNTKIEWKMVPYTHDDEWIASLDEAIRRIYEERKSKS
jgi:hypothetical protein